MKRVLSYIAVALGTLICLSCGRSQSGQQVGAAHLQKQELGKDFNLSDTDSKEATDPPQSDPAPGDPPS